MPYEIFKFEKATPAFEIGAIPLYVVGCPWWPTVLSEPMLVGGQTPGAAALEQMRLHAPNHRVRSIPLQRIESGLEPLISAPSVIDVDRQVQNLRQISEDISEYSDHVGENLRDFGVQCEYEASAGPEGNRTAVRNLLYKEPHFRVVVKPTFAGPKLQEAIAPLVDLGRALNGDTSKVALATIIRKKLESFDQETQAAAALLHEQLIECAEPLAALSAHHANLQGTSTKAFLLMTRDVNDLLANHRDQFVEAIAKIKSSPYLDVIFANVLENPKDLQAMADELLPHRRLTLWATLECQTGKESLRLMQANPKLAKFSAGTVAQYVGTARHCGFDVPVSALVAAARLHRDQSGPVDLISPLWGPQPDKDLIAVDDISTIGWSDKTLERLAMDTGVNAVRLHESGVRSPMFGRTPSAIQGYQFIDSNRVGALLSGNIVAWLSQVIPGMLITPAMQRVYCDEAAKIFFTPFAGLDGFRGQIRPSASQKATTFAITLSLKVADPAENITVTYKQ